MSGGDWDHSNLIGRRPGRFLRLASRVSRGVRDVQAQVEPYARAWEAHNREAVAADGPLWVVLGDSMAQGVGASRHDLGWPGQLAPLVPGLSDLRLINLSRYGATVSDVVDVQLPALQRLSRLGRGPADLVTVVVGSNDLVSRARRRAIATDLPVMLEALPTGSVVASLPVGRPGVRVFNREVTGAVVSRGLVEAPFRSRPIDWRGKVAADHFHPNDAGYAAMARVVSEAVVAAWRR